MSKKLEDIIRERMINVYMNALSVGCDTPIGETLISKAELLWGILDEWGGLENNHPPFPNRPICDNHEKFNENG